MSGNGTDMGHLVSMVGQVLTAQEAMRLDLAEQGRTLAEQGRTLAQHGRTLAEQGRKLDDLSGQVAGLRQAVTDYHSSVLGHGILISELDARVRRIEQRLDLPPVA